MAVVDFLNSANWYQDQRNVPGPTGQVGIPIGPFGTKCILLIHASASSQAGAEARTTGAGIQLAIHLNPLPHLADLENNPVSWDECYEGQPGGVMTFLASASFALPLAAGTPTMLVEAKVTGYGSASTGNRSTNIRLQCIALAAAW